MAEKIKATMSTLVAVLITQIEVTAKKTDRLLKPVIRSFDLNTSPYRVEPGIRVVGGFDAL